MAAKPADKQAAKFGFSAIFKNTLPSNYTEYYTTTIQYFSIQGVIYMAGTENTVFVGKKGTMAYVLAVMTQFNNGSGEVTIKARGKAISRAVDVAEIVRHKFMKEAKVENIAIATDDITTDDGNLLKVSTIEIKIKK